MESFSRKSQIFPGFEGKSTASGVKKYAKTGRKGDES